MFFYSYECFSSLVEVLSMMVRSIRRDSLILYLLVLYEVFRSFREVVAVDLDFQLQFRHFWFI